jgi:hypothetical protein
VGPFELFDTSSFRVSDLRFGDFNGDGKTDIFGVANGAWSVTYSGSVNWKPLRSRLTNSVAGLIVGDFDGDGRADIIRRRIDFGISIWEISYGGTSDWTTLWPASLNIGPLSAVGRFDGEPGFDALRWRGNSLDIVSAHGSPRRHSRQDMR